MLPEFLNEVWVFCKIRQAWQFVKKIIQNRQISGLLKKDFSRRLTERIILFVHFLYMQIVEVKDSVFCGSAGKAEPVKFIEFCSYKLKFIEC